MMALKAARAFTGRPKIAKCEGAYHGSYDYAEVSLDPTPEAWGRNAPVSVAYARGTPDNVLADVVTIPFNDAEAAVSLIREHGPELACVLVDPMPNRAGLAPADKAYLEALRQITREVGALLIFDEVITFRLGYRGAQGLWNIDPDLTTLGKIIGGGFPVGAIAGRKEFMAVFDPRSGKPALPHGGTFSANPVTMRAGLAAMELLDEAAFARLDAIGEAVRAGINEAFRRNGVPGGTVGLGSLLKIHFADRPIRDYRSAYLTEQEAQRQAIFNRGLAQSGRAGRGLRIDGAVDADDRCRYRYDRRGGVGCAGGGIGLGLTNVNQRKPFCQQERMSPKIDPITRSVVQHRLSSIVKEMGEAMLRTSYSQILNSSRDFSLAICDTSGRLIAQADHIPVHVGALPWATLAVEERFKDVRPGDVILLNDPYHGGSHLPDLTAFVPIFDGERRLLWTIVRAHQSDIGGATHGGYNPAATEIWQEGLRVPPIKLYEAGRLRDDLLDLLALNIRNPREFRGDLAAMVGAAHLGERRLSRLFAEFGAPVVEAAVETILDAAEAQTRAVVSTWKDGVFYGEAFLDDDGHGRSDIRIAAKVTKTGSDIEVDLSDSDPQSTSFVNSSHANMQAAVVMAFAYLIDADIPKNAGALRPLKVIAKQGHHRLGRSGPPGDALHQPSLERDRGRPSSRRCRPRVRTAPWRDGAAASGSRSRGEDPRTGRNFIWHMFQARPGGGASSGGDGWSSIGEWHTVGGIKFGSIEVAEVRFPLHFRHHEFRAGSGGDGQFRGGLGVALDLVLETAKPALANTAGDGVRAWPVRNAWRRRRRSSRLPPDLADRAPRVLRTKEVGIEIRPRRLPRNTFVRRRRLGAAGAAIAARPSARPRTGTHTEQRRDGAGFPMMFTIGIDVGGTYTDLVAIDESGKTVFAKSPSTPADQSVGVMAGLEELARRLKLTRAEMLGRDRPGGSRHHGCDQCPAGAKRRQGRAAHHRGPSRRHRDARRPQRTTATICVRRRRNRWCRASGVLASRNGSRPMATS